MVTASLGCPQQSVSCWVFPYLMGKGMGRAEVEDFHRIMHAQWSTTTGCASDGVEPSLDAGVALAASLGCSVEVDAGQDPIEGESKENEASHLECPPQAKTAR